MPLLIEFLRVKPFPPGACPILFGQPSVVRNTGERTFRVSAAGRFIPAPGVGCMDAYAQPEAVFAGRRRPFAHDVPLWAQGDGIPALVFAVIQVEVVMVVRQREEVAGAGVGI